MASVNFQRLALSAAVAAVTATGLAACGSSNVPSSQAQPTTGCPTAAPESAPAPDWTFTGATGSVAVTGSTDTAAPVVEVTPPFSVTETQVQTLQTGDGPVVADTASVSVCYMGVNGRDGSVFDSSYQTGDPVEFPLDGVISGFQKAIAGQNVGSTVAVAMTPEDGYPSGQPAAGIMPGDSLIFAIKILEVR
ncbi:FKBP-type peptidyl-prolyl cis-trans isomerase [Mycobacterium sp. pV006]|uniref:FKBP-type peptidyl-prolyl cis-trans isomerase n=1 Tax=Mycobacterium sp. pV006 TaxID=3238983 RepID=UPI00351BAC4D